MAVNFWGNNDIPMITCLSGGNWNNGAKCGVFYLNLNNAPSNSNTNIGAHLMDIKLKNKIIVCPCHMAKIPKTLTRISSPEAAESSAYLSRPEKQNPALK